MLSHKQKDKESSGSFQIKVVMHFAPALASARLDGQAF